MKSIVFNGNCQLYALEKASAFNMFDSAFFLTFRPEEQSGPTIREVKEDLLRFVGEEDLRGLVRFGGIGISVTTKQIVERQPDVLVFNLFHKRELFTHREKGYTISCKIDELCRHYPELAQYVKTEFSSKYQSMATYFEELYAYVASMREMLPSTKMFMLERFTPDVCSEQSRQWLAHWDDLHEKAPAFYARVASELNVALVDTRAVLDEIIAEGVGIDDLFPYFIPKLVVEKGNVFIELVRDLEHGTMIFWEQCGHAILQMAGVSVPKPSISSERPAEPYDIYITAQELLHENDRSLDSGPLVEFIEASRATNQHIDLTAFFASYALLFCKPEVLEAVAAYRNDFRFSKVEIFDYIDLATGKVDIADATIFFWGVDSHTADLLDELKESGCAGFAGVTDSDGENLDLPLLASGEAIQIAQQEDVVTVVAQQCRENYASTVGPHCRGVDVASEAVVFWLAAQNGRVKLR